MPLPKHNQLVAGAFLAAAVAAGIVIGSHGLTHFDPALTGYAIGSIIAAFAVGYRFVIWAQRPPSRMYFKRGFQLMFRRVEKVPGIAGEPPGLLRPDPSAKRFDLLGA